MCVDAIAQFAFPQHLSVPERDSNDAVPGATAIPVNVAREPADVAEEEVGGFGPLEAVLEAVSAAYTNHGVRTIRFPFEALL